MNKPSRNDPCPCGSGKKYKKCCELKKPASKKFTATLLGSGESSEKIQGLSRLLQQTKSPVSPPTENNS